MGYDSSLLDDFSDDGARHDRRPRDRGRRRRPLRTFATVVGVLALVGVLVIGGYAFYLQRTAEDNITNDDLFSKDAVITISPGETQPEDGDDAAVADDGASPIVDEDGEVLDFDGAELTAQAPERPADAGDSLNFLVIGTDSRDLSTERGRSDVIVLMHVNDDRSRVDLVHFPRDLFVPIPGTGGASKINAAYALGGAPLLVQTLQPLLDVPIDHVALVNFESFRSMTDAIGGVEVDVNEASADFSEGRVHMDGETGLRFVRERYDLSQGDISRGERQMAFIKGIMQQTLSRETLTNPARIARFVDAATTNLTVDADLRVSDMRDLLFEMRNVRGGDINFHTGPWCGIDMHPNAGSIVVMAGGQMSTLSEHLRTDSMDSYTDEVSPTSGFGGSC